jgi:hypothetical protein
MLMMKICHVPKGSHLHTRRPVNLKSKYKLVFSYMLLTCCIHSAHLNWQSYTVISLAFWRGLYSRAAWRRSGTSCELVRPLSVGFL